MQYILTEEEYRNLAPASKLNELREDIKLLNRIRKEHYGKSWNESYTPNRCGKTKWI